MWGLNPRPWAHKTHALPTELNEFFYDLYKKDNIFICLFFKSICFIFIIIQILKMIISIYINGTIT